MSIKKDDKKSPTILTTLDQTVVITGVCPNHSKTLMILF